MIDKTSPWNKLQWNLNPNTAIFIQENTIANFSRPQCFKDLNGYETRMKIIAYFLHPFIGSFSSSFFRPQRASRAKPQANIKHTMIMNRRRGTTVIVMTKNWKRQKG